MDAAVDESKKFYQLLLSALHLPTFDSVAELEKIWKVQRLKLGNLLKHSGKSAADRQTVQSASLAPGIRFSDISSASPSASSCNPRQGYVIFQQQFVDEALILSDLFNLNELEALKLIIAGQRETSVQPDWPRGLCAVYLFYKNRWYQAQSIKLLMRNRTGRYWHFDPGNGSDEEWAYLRNQIRNLTDELWKDNFLANVLGILQALADPVQSEFERMQQQNVKGLGGPRHRKMVADCIQETYSALGDALYYWCCQTPLDQREFLSLVRFAADNTGKTVRLPIVFSILQALDVSILESSDSEEAIAQYAPFIINRSLLFAVNSEIVAADGQKWADVGAQSIVQMAWAVSLRLISQNPLTQNILEDDSWNQDEEDIITNALQLLSNDIALSKSDMLGPFHWLRRFIVTSAEFTADELYQRRLHSFFTQLIASFPLKMKDLRSEADEECRQLAELTSSGVIPAALPCLHFEQFMVLLGEFYKIASSSNLNLSELYFCPIAQEPGTPIRRIQQGQVALYKFLKTSGEMLPRRLYVAYLRMLTGLAATPLSARLCFEMLKSFAAYGESLCAVSLDNFFAALGNYLGSLKASAVSASSNAHILPDEMKGLQAWFDLIAEMAEQDGTVRLALFEQPRWSCPANMLGLVTCAIPLELKGRALRCLTALAQSPELALALSEGLLASGIITSLSENRLGGVQQELEEVESRLETYPITTGLINFLATLCQHRTFVPDGPTIAPYVNFVLNSVLVHLLNRNYKTPTELWGLTAAVFRFMYNVVNNYDPTVASVIRQSLGSQILAALTNDGPVFRMVCRLCISGVHWLDEYKDSPDTEKAAQEATLCCLKLLYVSLAKQDAFNAAVVDSGVPLLTTSLDVLLQMLNPSTGEADYIVNIALFLTHYSHLPEHCLYAVRIINLLNSSVVAQTRIVKYFLADQALSIKVVFGFTSCLSLDNVDASFSASPMDGGKPSESQIRAQTAVAVLELLVADVKRSSGLASLSHFLTGFDTRRPSGTKLENPGVDGTARTCLHAVLDIANASLDQDLETLSFGTLVEPAYRLLFWLAAKPSTAESTLRYLRTEHQFVRQHVAKLTLPCIHRQDYLEPIEVALATREVAGWVLKLCALELASVVDSQPSYIRELSKLLLLSNTDDALEFSRGTGLSTPGSSGSIRWRAGRERKPQRGRRLFEFLTSLKPLVARTAEETVVVPRLMHFEGIRLSKVIAACTISTAKGYLKCDIERLYDVLEQELLALEGNGVVGQMHLVREEIQNVVESLVRYNEIQRSGYVLRHTITGFSQAARLLFSVCSLEWLEPEQLDQAIIETITETLRANLTVAAPEVADLLLSLTTVLRRRFNSDLSTDEKGLMLHGESALSGKGYVGLLDGSLAKSGRKYAHSCSGMLSTALKLLIEATLKPENRRQDIRTSLYGALMNFFRLWKKPSELGITDDIVGATSFEPSMRERMAEEHWAVVNRYVADLVDILAKDAADGSEVTKTVAMCCLVTLLEHDAVHGGAGRKAFLNRGYMNAIKFPPQFQEWVAVIVA